MSTGLKKEITLPGKRVTYPAKTTMNLMQHESTAEKLPGMILIGIFVFAVLLLLAKLGIYDPLAAYNARAEVLQSEQSQLESCTAQLSDYKDVETKYRCYSYGYLTSEEASLVDVLSVVDESKDIVGKYGTLDSIAVSANTVALECTVSTLDDVSKIVADFYNESNVTGVTVGTASDEEDGSLRSALTVTVAKPAASAEGGEN